MNLRLAWHKLTHWEYWPYQVVYTPIYFQYLYYALRTRSFFYFNASNPTIRNGGFFMESKKEIYDLIPEAYYPKTVLIKSGTSLEEVNDVIIKNKIEFPFITKPDIGLRGTAVKKIDTEEDLINYTSKANFDFLIQEFISYPNEIGLFYVKLPNQINGKITGIVSKEFLIIKGNGKNSIKELLLKDPRYEFQLGVLQKEYGDKLNQILPENESLNLVPYGNHCRGTKFIDFSHYITPRLEETFTQICNQINGFYYGRMDIMFDSFEKLEEGKNFQIVEINGAISEPTHIYDPNHSLLFGWKELIRHFHYLYKISKHNKKNGATYLSFKDGVSELKKHNQFYNRILKF
ncbi:D-alanine--D-alanine ligase [Flavobacterium okayamense]|uniref:D-alanine--D-alanine ligase n=1 Tax=Flavobacterium okayamense TaxID=2830782 RepID=A0ABM7SA63_9FLAO|nr:D-alanine--D-alanine ligase [Flavobacterium okayamense]BCY29612.1 D-alanine--D-alanine ligase [Flavobacterium okayamense]